MQTKNTTSRSYCTQLYARIIGCKIVMDTNGFSEIYLKKTDIELAFQISFGVVGLFFFY